MRAFLFLLPKIAIVILAMFCGSVITETEKLESERVIGDAQIVTVYGCSIVLTDYTNTFVRMDYSGCDELNVSSNVFYSEYDWISQPVFAAYRSCWPPTEAEDAIRYTISHNWFYGGFTLSFSNRQRFRMVSEYISPMTP